MVRTIVVMIIIIINIAIMIVLCLMASGRGGLRVHEMREEEVLEV